MREPRCNALFYGAKPAILLIDPETGAIVDANPAACAYYGHAWEVLARMNIADINALSRREVEAEMERAAREERSHFYFVHRLASGELRDVEVHSGPIEADGRALLYSIVHDITRRKRAEEALAKSEAFNRRLVETAGEGIWVVDAGGLTTFVNQRLCAMLGYAEEEILGRPPEDFMASPAAGGPFCRLECPQPGGCGRQERRFRRKDGGEFWAAASCTAFEDGQGAFAMLADITGRKRTEARLAELAEHRRAILESTDFAVVATDTEGRITSVNPAAEKMLGYQPGELLGKTPLVYHDWQEIVQRAAELSAKHGRIVEPGFEVFAVKVSEVAYSKCDWTHVRKDGSKFPVGLTLSALKNPEGGVAGYLGVAEDKTLRKQTEAELRIAATAFESQEGMFITDADTVILRVNKAFTAITGYSPEEAIGRTPAIFQSGHHPREFYRAMWESLARDCYWQGDVYNRRKNGEIYSERLNITAVKDAEGRVTNYVAAFTDITQYKKHEEAIYQLAFYDPLTSLPNRRLLVDRVKQMMNGSARRGTCGAVFFIDLDNFKELNDTQGHDTGDLLLVEVARRIQSQVRQEDTVARIGGDEFVVLLSGLDGSQEKASQQAEAVAEKIRQAINQPFLLEGHEYHSSPSIGISLFQDHQTDADELFKFADAAMYQAKHSGRNTVRFFDPATQAAMESRVRLESWMREAIPHQFGLHYQAQVDIAGRIRGAEVLLRLHHPQKGMIPPDEFIPLAEASGLIIPIGDLVLHTACAQLKAWEAGPATRHLHLSVNVSAKQFRQPDFVEKVVFALNSTGASPARLKLELTESLLIDDAEGVVAKMTALKNLGVRFSLDDFGTGFSSLAYLKTLPLDQLKIDQSFVRDVLTDPNDAAIARTVIALARSLGLGVIAEGVETEAQRVFLARHGCDNFQGYLFGEPVTLAEFEKSLQQTGSS